MNNAKTFPLSPSYAVTESGEIIRAATGQGAKPGRVLRASLRGASGYLCVSLWESGKGKTWFVHDIVATTFHGPRPSPKHHAAHWDGDKLNNHRDNLRWATPLENHADKVRHGRNNHAPPKTHCPSGHEYTIENSGHFKTGGRYCRTCRRLEARARRYAEKLARSKSARWEAK